MDFVIDITKHAYQRMTERGVNDERILDAFRFGAWSINDRQAFEFLYAGLTVIATKEANGFEVNTVY